MRLGVACLLRAWSVLRTGRVTPGRGAAGVEEGQP